MTTRMFCAGIVLMAFHAAACQDDPTSPTAMDPLTAAAKGGGGGGTSLYTLQFSDDIQATVSGARLSSRDPLGRVSLSGITFQFPAAATGNTAICDSKDPYLDPTTNDWRGYAAPSWLGDLTMSRGGAHVQLLGGQSDGSGDLNLVVNQTPVATQNDGTRTLTYTDARALISAFSYSEVDGTGQPVYDNQDRCVNFSVTATPE